MQTKIILSILVPDGAIIGNSTLLVFRVDDNEQYIENLYHKESVAILPTLEAAGSVQQFTVTALRDVSDRAIAQCLEDMSSISDANAHQSEQQKM